MPAPPSTTLPAGSTLRRRSSAGRLLVAASALAVLVQLVGLYQSTGPPLPPSFPHADKLAHALVFAAPVLLILLTLRRFAAGRGEPVSRRAVLTVTLLFALHAVLSEVAQHLWYVHRTGDGSDVIADWVGIAAGLGGFCWLSRHRPARRAP